MKRPKYSPVRVAERLGWARARVRDAEAAVLADPGDIVLRLALEGRRAELECLVRCAPAEPSPRSRSHA